MADDAHGAMMVKIAKLWFVIKKRDKKEK